MRRKISKNLSITAREKLRKKWQLLQKLGLSLCLVFACWLIFTTISLVSASSRAVDAFFVLGGSIRREIYIAQIAKENPQIPILISQGSPDPCIRLIFEREMASLQNVWLEKCANSTFDNFFYGIPILQRWGVHKVKVITSPTHLPRAKWMAQILFGSHGMWVEVEAVEEKGVPGNKESWIKTGLDLTRSFLWAVLSQIIHPQCTNVVHLSEVEIATWEQQGFRCEHQGGLGK